MLDIQKILNEQNLTIYGASQLLGAETDEPLKTIHKRISGWVKTPPRQWTDLEVFLNALGYTIKIKRKE